MQWRDYTTLPSRGLRRRPVGKSSESLRMTADFGAGAARREHTHRDGIDPTRPKAFCGCGCACSSGCAIVFPDWNWGVLAHVEHEIEPRREPVAGLGHSHHQLAAEQSVAAVHRLVRKIELGGEHALPRRCTLTW